LPLTEAQKMNKITRLLRIICREFNWLGYWRVVVAPFLERNRGKILALYDEIDALMKEEG